MPLNHYVTLGRSGLRVSPSCLGATTFGRPIDHLEDDLQALELKLTPEQVRALAAVSAPQLPFPIQFLERAPGVYGGRTTTNGEPSEPSPILPRRRGDHY